jgi:hypothetical protein
VHGLDRGLELDGPGWPRRMQARTSGSSSFEDEDINQWSSVDASGHFQRPSVTLTGVATGTPSGRCSASASCTSSRLPSAPGPGPVASSSPPISAAANTGPAGRRSVDEPFIPAPSDLRDRPASNPGNSLDGDIFGPAVNDCMSPPDVLLSRCRASRSTAEWESCRLFHDSVGRRHLAQREVDAHSRQDGVSARWRPAAVAPRLRRWSEFRCRTPRDAADR